MIKIMEFDLLHKINVHETYYKNRLKYLAA